ncbi:MAG: hypothetical protein ACYTEO_16520 [Planctomycetota bacterium]|jgi:hypothetical protein
MTVSNQTNRTSATGSGSTGQEVSFSFPITDTSDLVVIERVTATGVETTLTETTNYTVSISGDTGGTLTTVTAVAVTSQIHLYRDTPNTQATDLEQGDSFNAETIEDALDKVTKLAIENQDNIQYSCLRIPKTDSTSLSMEIDNSVDRASNYLAFSTSGEPTVVASVAPSTATITAAAQTVLDDATIAAMRTTLGVKIGTDVQAYDADLLAIGALAKTDSNIIVGNGTTWVAESGVTARTSLGLKIGTNVQAWDTQLDDIAALAVTNQNVIVADGTNWTAETGVTTTTVVCLDNAVVCYDNQIVVYV